MFIGKNLVYLRKKKGWDQLALAKKLGLGKTAISNYENESGEFKPKFEVTIAIAKLFNVKIDDLLYTDLEKRKVSAKGIQDDNNTSLITTDDPDNVA